MERYNWEQRTWPNFTYSVDQLEDSFFLFAEKMGAVSGMWNALPEDTQTEAVVDLIVSEAIKTSEIEGEYLSRKDVLSSVRKNLGLVSSPEHTGDKKAAGIGELMIDVRRTYQEPLTEEKLLTWHRMLLGGAKSIQIGMWRTHDEAMQVISGAMGKEKIHFEAPPSARVPAEMDRFIVWFNDTAPGGKKEIRRAPLRSAIAHLYFETIHPFEDGNGRVGRAIAEKALSQGIGRPVLLSLSQAIEARKQAYYDALSQAQRSNEITAWVTYFVRTVLTAQADAEEAIAFTLKKTKFFDRLGGQLNDRQTKVIRRMLEEGAKGFAGGMNAGKYGSIAGVSKATATRDLQELLKLAAIHLLGDAGGRSTKYQVNL
jgi:Fic family protein